MFNSGQKQPDDYDEILQVWCGTYWNDTSTSTSTSTY